MPLVFMNIITDPMLKILYPFRYFIFMKYSLGGSVFYENKIQRTIGVFNIVDSLSKIGYYEVNTISPGIF